jgi:hypothetical protein
MDNWAALRTVLEGDLEAFQAIVAMMQQKHKESVLIKERQQIEIAMVPFASLAEAVAHYLEVMEQIENGTYKEPDNDGGTIN